MTNENKTTQLENTLESTFAEVSQHVEPTVIYKEPKPDQPTEVEKTVSKPATSKLRQNKNHSKAEFEENLNELSVDSIKKSIFGYNKSQVKSVIENSRRFANDLQDVVQDLYHENKKLTVENTQLKEIRENTLSLGVTEDTQISSNKIDLTAEKLNETLKLIDQKDSEIQHLTKTSTELESKIHYLNDNSAKLESKINELNVDKSNYINTVNALNSNISTLKQHIEDVTKNSVSYETIGEVYTTAQENAQKKVFNATTEASQIKNSAEEYKNKQIHDAHELAQDIINEAKNSAKVIMSTTQNEVTEMLHETKQIRDSLVKAHGNMVKSARSNQDKLLNNLKEQKSILQKQVENVVDPTWHSIFIDSQQKLESANTLIDNWQNNAETELSKHSRKITSI